MLVTIIALISNRIKMMMNTPKKWNILWNWGSKLCRTIIILNIWSWIVLLKFALNFKGLKQKKCQIYDRIVLWLTMKSINVSFCYICNNIPDDVDDYRTNKATKKIGNFSTSTKYDECFTDNMRNSINSLISFSAYFYGVFRK